MALLSSGSISKSDVLPLFDAAMARFELINFISRRVLVDKPHPRFGNVKAIETLHFNHTAYAIEAYVLGEDYLPLIHLPQQASFEFIFDKISEYKSPCRAH
ncbi:MAG: hypothetical protein WC091_15915 [Sulfuricellaceae bacterium]